MADKDLPSCSDESDDDYVPEGVNEEVSEDDSDVDSNEEDPDNQSSKKTGQPKNKKRKLQKDEPDEDVSDKKEKSPIRDKDYVDKIWQEFQGDVKKVPTVKSSDETPKESPTKCKEDEAESAAKSAEPEKVNTQRLNLMNRPGIIKTNVARGGLSSVLSQLGKKDKLSTLEKSKLDWNNFKRSEGIDEDIKTFNRGKEGFLEKQDFLQRTDLRQFELEKQLRSTKRSFR